MRYTILVFAVLFFSCTLEKPTEFSKLALQDTAFTLNDSEISIDSILKTYQGKKILIDVWASWCGDCIKGLPSVKNLQNKFPKVVFLFLSVDKNRNAWKNGIRRFKIKGEHYNLPNGMKSGDFVDFLNLGWIPRYMVIDENGKIALFKATRASDSAIEEALN
ncbi:TlpA family protein disulfide reductase [Polaribacter sp.]|uniref:TlpA family protein disulfide reductase n=1 Tax=Polaribacter sp. TaxID=1920175 RepID=UPI003F6D4F6C